jgi:hypothetical protein
VPRSRMSRSVTSSPFCSVHGGSGELYLMSVIKVISFRAFHC